MILLKGHEDLRQVYERVMQLFGLVNTLLQNDSITSRHNLSIQRYSGLLIGWVPNVDTIHQVIRSLPRRAQDHRAQPTSTSL